MGMKTLYVHAGTPKTGTTSIQMFCSQNKEVLEKKGFCFPDMPYRYRGKRKERNGAFLTAMYKDAEGNRVAEEEKRILAEGLGIVRELFKKHENVILTDEALWIAVKKRRRSLWEELDEAAKRDGYVVKLIVYLRRQDDFAVSSWNQRIKKRVDERSDITQSWEAYLANIGKYTNVDYYHTLEHAASVLGKDNIIVRRYDRRHLKNGLAQADFLDALGLDLTGEYALDQPMLNEKLSFNGCEIKRVINEMTGFINMSESHFFEKPLLEIAEASNREYPSVIWSAADAKAYVDSFAKDNQKIADDFIGDGQPLFHDEYRDGQVWQRDNPHMGEDILRFTVMSHGMLSQEIRSLEKRLDRMERGTQSGSFAADEDADGAEAAWDEDVRTQDDMIRFVAMSNVGLFREIQGIKKRMKRMQKRMKDQQPLPQGADRSEQVGRVECDSHGSEVDEDLVCFAAMTDFTLLKGMRELKAQNEQLRQQMAKGHPFQKKLRALVRKSRIKKG